MRNSSEGQRGMTGEEAEKYAKIFADAAGKLRSGDTTDADMENDIRNFECASRIIGKGTINETVAPKFDSCSVKDKYYCAAFDMTPMMCNPWGAVHGGILATAFDSMMGTVAFYFGGCRKTQTLSMQISYLRSGDAKQRLFIRSRITKAGKTVTYVTAEAWSEDRPDKLIATASGVYFFSEGAPFQKTEE